MPVISVTKTVYECDRCGYQWEPRKPNPKACPYCKRYLKRTAAIQSPVIERSKAERVSEAKPSVMPNTDKHPPVCAGMVNYYDPENVVCEKCYYRKDCVDLILSKK